VCANLPEGLSLVTHFDDKFNVTWDDPHDAESIWAIDRIHFTHPLTPLTQDLYTPTLAPGTNTTSTPGAPSR
jgi:hypothetical protein